MLKVLRKKGVMKIIMWIVAIVIIVVFGFMGEAYLLRDGKPSRYAGEVFGQKISSQEFQEHLDRVVLIARLQYGQEFENVRESMNMEEQAWNHIILSKEAKNQDIRVSDQEVIEEIKKYPFFYRDNRFDQELYKNILRYHLGLTAADFEDLIRQNLKVRKLFNRQATEVIVPEKAILEAYRLKNAEVIVDYIPVNTKQFLQQVPYDEIKAKDFYIQNKRSFVQPPTVNVAYVRIPYPPDDTPETEEKRKQAGILAEHLTKKLSSGEDIRTAAQSLGLTVEESGSFSKEQPKLQPGWTFSLVEKIFRFNEGEVLGPVRTPEHLQVLLIKKKQPRIAPEYAKVKEDVAKAWKKHAASQLARKKTLEIRQELQTQWSQNAAIELMSVKDSEVKETGSFKRGAYLPDIGLSPEFQAAAFALTPENPVGGPAKIPQGYAVIHLKKRAPLDMEQFAKEKDRIKAELLSAAKQRVLGKYVARLRLRADLKVYVGQK